MKNLLTTVLAISAAVTAATTASATTTLTLNVNLTSIESTPKCSALSVIGSFHCDTPSSTQFYAKHPGTVEVYFDVDEDSAGFSASFNIDGKQKKLTDYYSNDYSTHTLNDKGIGRISTLHHYGTDASSYFFDGTSGYIRYEGLRSIVRRDLTKDEAEALGIRFESNGFDTPNIMTIDVWEEYKETYNFTVAEPAPVPLPAGLPLLALGLASLGVARSRKTN